MYPRSHPGTPNCFCKAGEVGEMEHGCSVVPVLPEPVHAGA